MAKTYIGYAQREAAEGVDWSGVARKFTNMLEMEQEAREQDQAALDQANTDLATTLQTAPNGETQELHNYMLDYANNASNYQLMLKRSVDNGNMSKKQYTNAVNNLMAGTNQAISLVTKYNDFAKKQQEKINNDTMAGQKLYENQLLETMLDFSNTSLYIDPVTFKVSQGKTVEKTIGTGADAKTVRTMSTNTGDFRPVASMTRWMGEDYNKFDMSAAVTKIAGNMATSYQALGGQDGQTGIAGEDNVRMNKAYDKALDAYITSYLENPKNVTSILADYAGVAKNNLPFDFTTDENQKDAANMIYIQPNKSGGYDLDLDSSHGKKLRNAAAEVLKGAVDVKLPRKITPAATEEVTGFDYRKASEEEILGARNVKAFLQVGYGSEQERAAGIAHLKGANAGIVDIIPTDDRKGVSVVTKKDNVTSTQFIPFNSDARLYLDGSSQVVGAGVDIGKSLNYLQNTDPGAFEKFIVGQSGGRTDVRELSDNRSVANIPEVINYNEVKINTDKRMTRKNAVGVNVETDEFVQATPGEIIESAITDNVALRDINRLADAVVGVNKVVEGLNIGALNDENSIVKVIDDDTDNSAGRELNSYMTGDNSTALGLSSLQIYYPELMSGPIFIPDQGERNAKETARILDQVYGTLVQAANEGRRLAPNDFSIISNNQQIKDYNKEAYDWGRANNTFKDVSGDKFEWNDGLGLTYDSKQYDNLPPDVQQVRVGGKQVLLRDKGDGTFEMVEEVDLNTNVNSQGTMTKYNQQPVIISEQITIDTVKEKLGNKYQQQRDMLEVKFPITDGNYKDAAAYEKFIDAEMIKIAQLIN